MPRDHARQLANADVFQSAADEDWHHAPLAGAFVQRGLDLGVRQVLALEVLLHELVGGFRRGLHQRVAARVLDALQLVGDRDLGGLARLVDGGVLLDHVDVAAEPVGGADGQVDRRDLGPEGGLELVEDRVVVGVLAVHLVDEHEARQPSRIRQPPHLVRPHFDPGTGVDHHDRRVHRCQRFDDVGLEVGVARRVDDRDPHLLMLERPDRQVDALLAFLLVRVPVEGRGAGIDAPQPRDRAGIEEHRFREARLAGATVGDERDVANLVGCGGLHRGLRLLAHAQRRRGDSLRRMV